MPPRPDLVVKAGLLQRAYAANQQSHVAFIDESYLPPSRQANQPPFYLATAYIAPCSEHEGIRDDLTSIVGDGFWHTTDAHRRDELRPTITKLCQYIADGGNHDEHIVIVIKKPILPDDSDGESARTQCLIELFAALHSGTVAPAVSLIVFEERKFQTQQNADTRTIKLARDSGRVGRNTRIFPASPSYERLLWMPDVISLAVYQRHTIDRHGYLAEFEDRVHYLTVE